MITLDILMKILSYTSDKLKLKISPKNIYIQNVKKTKVEFLIKVSSKEVYEGEIDILIPEQIETKRIQSFKQALEKSTNIESLLNTKA